MGICVRTLTLWLFVVNFLKYRPSKLFRHSQRRRMWSRIMRREIGIPVIANAGNVIQKISNGLVFVNATRKKIEDITRKSPEAAGSEQMMVLVSSVQKGLLDISNALGQVEAQHGNDPKLAGTFKKLRNDLLKEEARVMC